LLQYHEGSRKRDWQEQGVRGGPAAAGCPSGGGRRALSRLRGAGRLWTGARSYGREPARRLAKALEYQWNEDPGNEPVAIR